MPDGFDAIVGIGSKLRIRSNAIAGTICSMTVNLVQIRRDHARSLASICLRLVLSIIS